jgi:hypothetical protein
MNIPTDAEIAEVLSKPVDARGAYKACRFVNDDVVIKTDTPDRIAIEFARYEAIVREFGPDIAAETVRVRDDVLVQERLTITYSQEFQREVDTLGREVNAWRRDDTLVVDFHASNVGKDKNGKVKIHDFAGHTPLRLSQE